MTILFIVLGVLSLVAVDLPGGMDRVHFGITPAELQKIAPAQKVEPGPGYGYAEHTEQNPDVYVQKSDGQKRIEYYFARGKLYKIFTLYERTLSTPEFYAQLLDELKKKFGAPGRAYEDETFGIRVIHNEWKDAKTTLDLRMGGSFVYEVRYENGVVKEKEIMKRLKHSI